MPQVSGQYTHSDAPSSFRYGEITPYENRHDRTFNRFLDHSTLAGIATLQTGLFERDPERKP